MLNCSIILTLQSQLLVSHTVGEWAFPLNFPLQVMEHESQFSCLSGAECGGISTINGGGFLCSLKTAIKLSKVQSSRDLDLSFPCVNESAQDN